MGATAPRAKCDESARASFRDAGKPEASALLRRVAGIRFRRDAEAARAFAALVAFPHGGVGRLEVTAEAVRVEERARSLIFLKLLPNGLEMRPICRQPQGQRVIFLKA